MEEKKNYKSLPKKLAEVGKLFVDGKISEAELEKFWDQDFLDYYQEIEDSNDNNVQLIFYILAYVVYDKNKQLQEIENVILKINKIIKDDPSLRVANHKILWAIVLSRNSDNISNAMEELRQLLTNG